MGSGNMRGCLQKAFNEKLKKASVVWDEEHGAWRVVVYVKDDKTTSVLLQAIQYIEGEEDGKNQ